MGTFEYTIGGSFNAEESMQGTYKPIFSPYEPASSGSNNPSSVGYFGDVSDTGNYNLIENSANGDGGFFSFLGLFDKNGDNLNAADTGYGLYYDSEINDLILNGGSLGDDIFSGSGNDTLVGAGGADHLYGGGGINTASYERSFSSVIVNLTANIASGGDAEGDTFSDIQNLTGSQSNDTLTGDTNANVLIGGAGNDTLRGLGGADTLDGGAGNDRLVVSHAMADGDGLSRVTIHGDGEEGDKDVDTLFLQGHDTFKFDSSHFDGVEKIYVADGASLDLTGITAGVTIISQSTLSDPKGGSDNVTGSITGTDAADTIKGGKGNDFINGGAGGDKLTAGSAHDTFVFTEGFGRDNVYRFTVSEDHFDVSALVSSFEDVNIKQLNASDTLITFDGAGSGNKIILHDVAASSLHASDFGFFLP